MDKIDAIAWILEQASESDLSLIESAIEVARNRKPQENRKRRAWDSAERRELKKLLWAEMSRQEKEEYAAKTRRTVSACNFKWMQMHGKWK